MAMHSYGTEHGRLPPAVVYGADGRPLHSWRVLLLPYLDENELFKQFRLDEPWDSPHNIKLLDKMPSVYAPPSGKAGLVPPYHTVFHVFVGKGAAFEGKEGLRWEDFTDGPANTFLIVEAGEPVPWTKPEDIAYDPDGPVPPLRCIFRDGFRAGMGDGRRTWVPKETSEAAIRAQITRNAGDGFDLSD